MKLTQFLRTGRAGVRASAPVTVGATRELVGMRGQALDRAALGTPAQPRLFVALADWVESFEGMTGRRVPGVRTRIVKLDCEGWSAAAGRLLVEGVAIDVDVDFETADEEPVMKVVGRALGSGASGAVQMVGEDGGWATMPGRRLSLSAPMAEMNEALDAALVPMLLQVIARHREAGETARDGDDRDEPRRHGFARAHATSLDTTLRAYEGVASYAGDLVRDLEQLPADAPARSLIRTAGELATAARAMGGDDGYRGDPSDREHDDPDATEAPTEAPRATNADVEGTHRLYDVADVDKAMQAGGDEGSSRMGFLRRLVRNHETAGRRRLVVADAATVARIDALAARAPHLAEVSAMARRHARASMNTGMPMTLPPLVLLGEGGIGKTWYLSRLGEALGVPFRGHPLSGSTLAEALQGSNAVYKNGHAGLVANTLLNEEVANPLVFIDEFDKATEGESDPYRPFYVLLEPEGSRRFTDEYLGFDVDASRISWTVAANDLSKVPAIVLDRMTVIDTPLPSEDQMGTICDSIATDLGSRLYGGYFNPLSSEVRGELSRRHPRGARKALGEAMTSAAAEGRRDVLASDLPRERAKGGTGMGFIRH